MENVTSPANSSTGTNGIICASVVQYGHGFLHGDAVFNSALAYLLAQIIIVTASSRLLGTSIFFLYHPSSSCTMKDTLFSFLLFHVFFLSLFLSRKMSMTALKYCCSLP